MRTHLKPLIALTALLAGLASACGTAGPNGQVIPPVATPSVNRLLADVISPGLDHSFVFEHGQPPVQIQPGSKDLLGMIKAPSGLHIFALLSTADSAAILLIEDDPKVPWGTHLHPAEITIFKEFAANPNLGNWLIVLDDVVVHGPKDPVPLTAYRWPRADVEQYVACGIPPTLAQNACSKTFYLQAVTVIIAKSRQKTQG